MKIKHLELDTVYFLRNQRTHFTKPIKSPQFPVETQNHFK